MSAQRLIPAAPKTEVEVRREKGYRMAYVRTHVANDTPDTPRIARTFGVRLNRHGLPVGDAQTPVIAPPDSDWAIDI